MGGSKTIRLSEENWRRLRDLKREGESFDDVVSRLTTGDRWSGFGALEGADIHEGVDDAHERLEAELRERAEETNG